MWIFLLTLRSFSNNAFFKTISPLCHPMLRFISCLRFGPPLPILRPRIFCRRLLLSSRASILLKRMHCLRSREKCSSSSHRVASAEKASTLWERVLRLKSFTPTEREQSVWQTRKWVYAELLHRRYLCACAWSSFLILHLISNQLKKKNSINIKFL